MAEHSPEQDRLQEPESLSEAAGPDRGSETTQDVVEPGDARDHNPLARAFRKLREGRGRETASLYHDIVRPSQTPVMVHIGRGVAYDELGNHELAIDEFLAATELEPENVDAASRSFQTSSAPRSSKSHQPAARCPADTSTP